MSVATVMKQATLLIAAVLLVSQCCTVLCSESSLESGAEYPNVVYMAPYVLVPPSYGAPQSYMPPPQQYIPPMYMPMPSSPMQSRVEQGHSARFMRVRHDSAPQKLGLHEQDVPEEHMSDMIAEPVPTMSVPMMMDANGYPVPLIPAPYSVPYPTVAPRFASSAPAMDKKRLSQLRTFYHTTRELHTAFEKLALNCAGMNVTWEKSGNKKLMAIRLSRPNLHRANNATKERVLFYYGEHARELISPETGLEFVKLMCSADAHKTIKGVGVTVEQMWRNADYLIYPVINPSGRRRVEQGSYCHRTNDNGVDLNRNWGDHWESPANHLPGGETHPGKFAFSEDETRIIRAGSEKFHPTIFLSVHSGSLHMLTPWAFTRAMPGEPGHGSEFVKGPGVKPLLKVLRNVNQQFCRCNVGVAGKELGYLCPGTCLDYMYNKVGTRFSYALEIYSGRYGYKKRGNKNLVMLQTQEKFHSHRHTVDRIPANVHDLDDVDESCFIQSEKVTHRFGFVPDMAFVDTEVDRQHAFPLPSTTDAYRCLKMFNPLDKLTYQRTIKHWSKASVKIVAETFKNQH